MKSTHIVAALALTASLATAPAAYADSCSTGHTSAEKASHGEVHEAKNIVETAVEAGSFGTLVAAVKAAGLVETLAEGGPFTVFAPTDEAFAKLPKGTVESLLKPENKDKLIAILTYHVVSGEVTSANVIKVKTAKTVQGQDLAVTFADGEVMINNANVVKADITAGNGVIHVIDTVLLPTDM